MAIQTTLTWVRQDDGSFTQEIDVERVEEKVESKELSREELREQTIHELEEMYEVGREFSKPSYPSGFRETFLSSDVDALIEDEDEEWADRLGAIQIKLQYIEEDDYNFTRWGWDITIHGPDTDWVRVAVDTAYDEGCGEDHLPWRYVDWDAIADELRNETRCLDVLGEDVYYGDY